MLVRRAACTGLAPVLLLGWSAASTASGQDNRTYRNPLFASQDPHVLMWQGTYYYTDSDGDRIRIRRSPTLTGLRSARPQVVWTSTRRGWNGHANLWAPELHRLNDRWYIYFAADYKTDGRHFLYVLEGGDNPMGPYAPGRTGDPDGLLAESSGKWAIDPNVFTAPDGALYIVWSCTGDEIGKSPQNLCIARMSDPLHISGPTVRIASPTEAWETRGGPIAEGPVAFVRDGIVHLTYSASASWTTNDYAVGLLTNRSGDLLNPAAWEKTGPVFDRHGKTYGPGSAIFVPSPDESELWLLYHAYDRLDCRQWACRSIRMQKVSWTADGGLLAGYPLDPQVPGFVPSGDTGLRTGWGDSRAGAHASGAWTSEDRAGVEDGRGTGERGAHRIFRGDVDAFAYTVSAEVREDDRFRAGQPGAYGIYAAYRDEGNYVAALIDPANGVFVTRAAVAGELWPESTHPLPAGFSAAGPHTIAAAKSADGRFAFFLDGIAIGERRIPVESGQVGAIAENAAVRFREFRVHDAAHGWGNASGDAAQGLPRMAPGTAYGDGYVHGAWEIVDGTAVRGVAPGPGWHTLYRGNPNFGSFRVEVEARRTGGGSYGLIACYDDRNNQTSLWVDPARRTLRLDSTVRGVRRQQAVPLPAAFDPVRFHKLAAEKRGSLFTFLIDDIVMMVRDIDLSNGAAGVATEDATADFRAFRFAPLR